MIFVIFDKIYVRGNPIGTILAIFNQEATLIPFAKFRVNQPFGSSEEVQIGFQDGCHGDHLGFPIKTI